MNKIIPILIFPICLAAALISKGQESRYEMSKPLDMSMVGVNKVLLMRNGNTLLFHFEPSKAITIKVFDANRKEIASREELCHYLDVYTIQDARFKGLYDIGGEAVLFFDQQNLLSKHRLIRLRFQARDGSLIEEKIMAESKNKEKQIRFYVMKKQEDDTYAILYSLVTNYPRTADLTVEYYNSRHETIKTVHLDADRNKFDYLDVMGADYLNRGVVVTLGLSAILQNGTISHGNTYDTNSYVYGPSVDTRSHNSGGPGFSNSSSFSNNFIDPRSNNYDELDPVATRFNHYVAIYYIGENSSVARSRMADVSPDVYPFHAFHTHNNFSGAINTLLFGYKDGYVQYGMERLPAAVMNNILLKLDDNDLDVKFNNIDHKLANKYLKEKTDTGKVFLGATVGLYTNENGLSTLVSESFTRYANVESPSRPRLFETWLGDIAVTQFDDDGNELWGIVLPRSQYYKSYVHYYYSGHLAAKWHDYLLFGDIPEQVYNRQFLSLNAFPYKKDYYVVFNDDDMNFHKNFDKPCDTVYSFAHTNAIFYSISSKKEVVKHYLFGAPQKAEYKSCFIEGACFDDRSGIYASVIQYRKGEQVSLRMAWSHLDGQ